MLLAPSATEEAARLVDEAAFYAPSHGHIYTAVGRLAGRGAPVDCVSVAAELVAMGMDGSQHQAPALIAMMTACPATGNAGHYAALVAHAWRARRMHAELTAAAAAAWSGDTEAAVANLGAVAALAVPVGGGLAFEDLAPVMRGEEPGVKPGLLFREDGAGLLYPGLLHWLAGEPGCGKTWLAMLAAKALLDAGGAVVYLDWEGNRRIIGGRLLALGMDEASVGRMLYHKPLATSAVLGAEVGRVVADRGAGLVIVDAAAKSMAGEGVDEDRNADVLPWMVRLCESSTRAGAAVLVLDHVTKSKEGRGRWARGAGAKLGEVEGVSYTMEVRRPWSRERPGYAALVVAKDREGYVGAEAETVALVHFATRGARLDCTIKAPEAPPAPGDLIRPGRDGGAMTVHEAVQAVIDATEGEITQRQLADAVRAVCPVRDATVREAARWMAEAGRIRRRPFGQSYLYAGSDAAGELGLPAPLDEADRF